MPRNDREFRHVLEHFVIGVAGARRARAGLRGCEFVFLLFLNPLPVLSCLGGTLRRLGLFDRAERISANVPRRIGETNPAALHCPARTGV
jgi:hypothetical protein